MEVKPAGSIAASPSANRHKIELPAKAHRAIMVRAAVLTRHPFSSGDEADGKSQQELTQVIQRQTGKPIDKLIFQEAIAGDKYIG